ncbi:MAG TPA: DMT family transporter [Rubrobacteraceae bacterium]|nr:DMT family transporter [Rubrobacteraceae bacterium]
MRGRDIGLLLALGAMWGSSFLFIKVALGEVAPAFIVACRVFFGALTLLAAVPFLDRIFGKTPDGLLRSVARLWRPVLVLGVFNAALPFLAISWGTQFLPSGTAAILNSTVPLFTALLAGLLPWITDERLGVLGVAGILLGVAGVAVLAGGFGEGFSASPSEALLGAGAIMTGSTSYAVGGLYARRAMKGVPVLVSAVGQSVAALVVILPFAALSLPDTVPSLPVLGSLVGLGAIGTGFSLLLYFKLIANVGATRTSTVTYLVPMWALVYGALLLGEDITVRAVLGLVLILLGVAGVTGFARLPRRRPPAAP